MRLFEIESWTQRVLERVENHLPVEDVRVELKADWINPVKAARRIAGHANAARGETILWIIGADEKQGVIVGAIYKELAGWFSQVKACFESEVPVLQDINVNYKGKTVAALCFETGRFPFLVKNPKGGDVQFEVPWRDGTAVRTATRNDLISLLMPLISVPKLQVLSGEIYGQAVGQGGGVPFVFKAFLYITPVHDSALTYPFHQCTAVLRSGSELITDVWHISIDSPAAREAKKNDRLAKIGQRAGYTSVSQPRLVVQSASQTIEATEDEVIIRG